MLTIPDIQNNPTFDGQAAPDSTDWSAIGLGEAGTGVVAGMEVSPDPTPDMGVTVAAGVYSIGGIEYLFAGGSVAVGSANLTDRKDIVVINAAGVLDVVPGSPCETANWTRDSIALGFPPPIKPSIPVSNCLLGEIYVAGGVGTITAGCITDKTVNLLAPALQKPFVVYDVVAQYGANPNGGPLAGPAQRAVNDMQANTAAVNKILLIPDGYYTFDHGTDLRTDGSFSWYVAITGDDIWVENNGNITDNATVDQNIIPFFFNAAGRTSPTAAAGGTGAMDYPNWITNTGQTAIGPGGLANPTYTMNAVGSNSGSITTTTPTDAGNFSPGDWLLTRAGQTIPSTPGGYQPDGELNQVVTANPSTGIITLKWPTGKSYALEYFLTSAGITSGTSPTPTAFGSIAPQVTKCTAKIGHNVRFYGNGTFHSVHSSAWVAFIHYYDSGISDQKGTYNGGMGWHQNCRKLFQLRMSGNRTATTNGNTAIAAGVATCTTDWLIDDIDSVGNLAAIHLHEGANQGKLGRFSLTCNNSDPVQGYGLSIVGRSYDLIMTGKGSITGGNSAPPVTVSNTCTAGGVLGNVVVRPGVSTQAVSCLGTGWVFLNLDPGSGSIGIGTTNYNLSGNTVITADSAGLLPGTRLPNSISSYFNWAALFPGLRGNYFSTPSVTANRITGACEMRIKVGAGSSMRQAGQTAFIDKDNCYLLFMNTAGFLGFGWTSDGVTAQVLASSAALPATLPVDTVIMGQLLPNDGSGNKVAKFATSTDDGVTWTPLGSTVTTAGTTSLFDSASTVIEIGATNSGTTFLFQGTLIRGEIASTLTPLPGGPTSIAVQTWRSSTPTGSTYVNPVTGETWTKHGTGFGYTLANLATSILTPSDAAQLAGAAEVVRDLYYSTPYTDQFINSAVGPLVEADTGQLYTTVSVGASGGGQVKAQAASPSGKAMAAPGPASVAYCFVVPEPGVNPDRIVITQAGLPGGRFVGSIIGNTADTTTVVGGTGGHYWLHADFIDTGISFTVVMPAFTLAGCSVTNGSPNITVPSTAGLTAGQSVTLTGFVTGTTILSVGTGTITVSNNFTGTTGTVSVAFGIGFSPLGNATGTYPYNTTLPAPAATTLYKCEIEFLGNNQIAVFPPSESKTPWFVVTDSRIESLRGPTVIMEPQVSNGNPSYETQIVNVSAGFRASKVRAGVPTRGEIARDIGLIAVPNVRQLVFTGSLVSLTALHELVEADCTSGVINLGTTASPPDGASIEIKKIDTTSNAVLLSGIGGATIDNASAVSFSGPGQQKVFVAKGGNWNSLQNDFVAPKSTFAQFSGAVTPTLVDGSLNEFDTTSGSAGPNLPPASSVYIGSKIQLVKTDATSNFVEVFALGSGTINGASAFNVLLQNVVVTFTYAGSNNWVTTGIANTPPPAVSSYFPASPTAIAVTGPLMAGLGGVIAFTPITTGKIRVVISGTAGSTTSAATVNLWGRYGTGTAPVNGAALVGTGFHQSFMFIHPVIASGVGTIPFTLMDVISGLTLNTPIWVDVAIGASSGGPGVISSLGVTIEEVS